MNDKIPVDGFIFDLDGTVYLGKALLPGALETITNLRQQGKRLLFISNKPLEPRQIYAQKLTDLGLPTLPEEILTSACILGQYLVVHHPGLRYYLVGEENLRAELRSYGLAILPELSDQNPLDVIDPLGIDAVIVSFDRTLDYRKLNTAYQALNRGAAFFATNTDKTCPVPGGDIPDAGAIVAYLEFLTNRKLELLAGKPSPMMIKIALARLALPPECCLLVGDRLETDIRMGLTAGIHTALVLTGVTKREDLTRATLTPEFVIDRLSELLDWVM